MDSHKDNQKAFQTSYGQVSKNTDVHYDLSLLYKGKLMSLIQLKTQNISLALHLVTEHLSEREALRHEIRRVSLKVVAAPEQSAIHTLLSHVSIAGTIGLISPINTSLLMTELEALLAKVRTLGSGTFILSRDILGEEFPAEKAPAHQVMSYKGQQQSNVLYKESGQKDTQKSNRFPKSEIALRLARTNNILKIIKDKKEVSVKDISSIVSEYSEKTIQRELQALVLEGVLKKVGTKRWSKYSFA